MGVAGRTRWVVQLLVFVATTGAVVAWASAAPAGARAQSVIASRFSTELGTDTEFDALGNAYVAWAASGRRSGLGGMGQYDGLEVPMVAVRPVGAERFGKPQVLSKKPAAEVELAVAPSGDAVAVWGTAEGIQYAVRPAGGRFGHPVSYRRSEYPSYILDVDIADDGSAMITWDDEYNGAHALIRDGLGHFRPLPGFSATGSNDVLGEVDAEGDMAIVWTTEKRSDYLSTIHLASRPAGGKFGLGRKLEGCLNLLVFCDVSLTMTANGEAILADGREYSACPLRGSCTAYKRILPPKHGQAQLVADDLGNIHALSVRYLGRKHRAFRIYDALRHPGEPFGIPRAVATFREPYIGDVAVGHNGELLLEIQTFQPHHRQAILTSRYAPADGWGAPQRVRPVYKEPGEYISSLSAGLAPDGSGLAVWEASLRKNSRLLWADLPAGISPG